MAVDVVTRCRRSSEDELALLLPLIDLPSNQVPQPKFGLPFVEQDRGGTTEEQLGGRGYCCSGVRVFVEADNGGSSLGGCRCFAAGFRAFDQDSTRCLQAFRE